MLYSSANAVADRATTSNSAITADRIRFIFFTSIFLLFMLYGLSILDLHAKRRILPLHQGQNASLKSVCLFLRTVQRDRISLSCLVLCLVNHGVRLHACQAPFKDNLVCVSLLMITERSAERKGYFQNRYKIHTLAKKGGTHAHRHSFQSIISYFFSGRRIQTFSTIPTAIIFVSRFEPP